MLLKEIIQFLESKAHPRLQESYDNSGLITGNPTMEITGAICCLDSTPEVIQEAINKGCNLIIAHHPILFSGLKKLNGKNYVERAIIDAIKNDIAIYAIHTNLDNVHQGVNQKMAEKIGLTNTRILEPKKDFLRKMVVFVPVSAADPVRSAMFAAGAGYIGKYDECSFNTEGSGTFRAGEGASPHVGEILKSHSEPEMKIEVVLPMWKVNEVIAAVKKEHPYEEIAFDIFPLENTWTETGSGLIGELESGPMKAMDFLIHLKKVMKTECIRYTQLPDKDVFKVAICGGSGSFLLEKAKAEQCDVLVTGDFKYHQFFDAEGKIIIADIGHYESEQFTMELLNDWMRQKFPNFASHLTGVITNPVHYL